ncbi:MAG: response regulator [Bacteroidota bacterium]
MAKILLIDQSPWIMLHMRKVLENSGHTVFVATDGLKGLEVIESVSPDLIFTDVVMPGKDGFEIITEIRKKHQRIKIIAMTSNTFTLADQYLRAMRSLGVELTVKKPFRDRYLLNAVQSVLEAG